jgi:hypothetical protein
MSREYSLTHSHSRERPTEERKAPGGQNVAPRSVPADHAATPVDSRRFTSISELKVSRSALTKPLVHPRDNLCSSSPDAYGTMYGTPYQGRDPEQRPTPVVVALGVRPMFFFSPGQRHFA